MQVGERQLQLHPLLTAVLHCTERLLDVLHQENLALRNIDPTRIEQTTEAKQALIQEIESHTVVHNRFFSTHNLPLGRQGMEGYLKTLPANAPEHEHWVRLQSLSARCREQNEVNGGILTLSRRHISQALEILRGNLDSASTYSRRGEALSNTEANTLAKA